MFYHTCLCALIITTIRQEQTKTTTIESKLKANTTKNNKNNVKTDAVKNGHGTKKAWTEKSNNITPSSKHTLPLKKEVKKVKKVEQELHVHDLDQEVATKELELYEYPQTSEQFSGLNSSFYVK